MLYTQRIFWPAYNSQTKLSELLAFLETKRDICDEISFFTEGDGLDLRYVPRAEVSRRAAFLKRAVTAAKERGFATAINVLNTMGHSDGGGPDAPAVPWQPMVGLDGAVCRQCGCPFDTEFLEYLRFKYEAMATAGAGKYWIDDDVRLNNHKPVEWGCFCPNCLNDFSQSLGRLFDRVSLLEGLKRDRDVRRQWVARNDRVMRGLLAACAEGVRRADPGAEIGFMCCDITDLQDCGVNWPGWFGELTSRLDGQAWLRPGGGFWSDDQPRAVLSKIHTVSNSVAALPPGVLSTYELENYPYVQGGKSAALSGLESLLVILGSRIDGIMFDVFDGSGNALAPWDTWARELAAWRPLWDQAADLVRGTTPVGWKPAYSPRHFEQHSGEELGALRSLWYKKPLALQLAGWPMTAFESGTLGHCLSGPAARGLSNGELRELLKKPLFMDGPAAQVFLEAGLGGDIGLDGITTFTEGVYEEFSQHHLNGSAQGYLRSLTLTYYGESSDALSPKPETLLLSHLRSVGGGSLGAALTLFQPPAGAPVAVAGHLPFRFALSPQRMEQLQNLSHLMTGLHPLKSTRPVAAWWRTGPAKTVAVLFNAGFDAARVQIQPGGRLALSMPGTALDAESGEVHLPAWSVAAVLWPTRSSAPQDNSAGFPDLLPGGALSGP